MAPKIRPGGSPKIDVPTGGLPTGVQAPKGNLKDVAAVKDTSALSKSFEGKTLDGKSLDELAEAPDVKTAAAKNTENLKKLGMAGLGAAGVAALMITYGESNPITAIQKALKDAASTAGDAASGIMKPFMDALKALAMPSAILTCIMVSVCIIYLLISVLK